MAPDISTMPQESDSSRPLPPPLAKPRRPASSIAQFFEYHFFRAILACLYLCLIISHFFQYEYHRFLIRLAKISYHHNRTPELIRQDVLSLKKIPHHVAAVLRLRENEEGGGVDGLLAQTSELVAWCLGAEIEALTIYERTGALKNLSRSEIIKRIDSNLERYFGASALPSFKLNIPPLTSPSSSSTSRRRTNSSSNRAGKSTAAGRKKTGVDLVITLIAEEDGRQSIVDLTKTLGELAAERQISPKDVSISAISNELKHLVVGEPDVVIIFGPTVDLDGFPPWQLRITEIFHMPDNEEVSYAVFLKGLERYAGCKINIGR